MSEVNQDTQEILADIFANSERPDKMWIHCDKTTRSIVITYSNIDEQWLNELLESIK